MNATKRCFQCDFTWDPRGEGCSDNCPRCELRVPSVVRPAQASPLSLDDTEPVDPVQPSLGRRAFWTSTLFVSIVAIVALHGAAFAIIYFAVKRDSEPPAASAPATQVAQAPEKSKPAPKAPKARAEFDAARPGRSEPPRSNPAEPKPTVDTPPPPVDPSSEIEIAPEPRAAGLIAPFPHLPIRLPVPDPPGWASEWDRKGDVQVRIRAVSLAALPMIGLDKARSFTAETYMVIWLEVQNVSENPRTYRRWQPVTNGECTLYSAAEVSLGIVIFPNKQRFEWTEDYERKLAPGAEPLLEAVFFPVPPDETSHFTLQLSAAHVGEKNFYRLKIPGRVLKK